MLKVFLSMSTKSGYAPECKAVDIPATKVIGDEIIVPNYTMIATINAVKFLKLVPVIVDVDKNTYTLNILK